MLLLFIVIAININLLSTYECNENYEIADEFSLTTENNIILVDYQQLQEGYSYSFWMKYIILLPSFGANEQDTNLFWLFGFLIFKQTVNSTFYSEQVLILYVEDNYAYFLFQYQDETEVIEQQIDQDEQNLDGVWIFFKFTYLPINKLIIIQKDLQIIQIPVETILSGIIVTSFEPGFMTLFGIDTIGYFLSSMPGYMSKVQFQQKIILSNDFLYKNYQECQMFEQQQEEVKYYFVKGMQKFYSGLNSFKDIIIQDERYQIRGWVQIDYNRIQIDKQYKITFVRVTINSYYDDNNNFGDRYFFYQYIINDPNYPNQLIIDSELYFEAAHYNSPYHHYSYNQRHSEPYDYDIWQQSDNKFYEQFQQWHYFIFEQARGESIEENSCVYLFFQGSDKIKHCFGKEKYRRQFTNNNLYIYAGFDDYSVDKFIGKISDLTILYNYNDLKPIQIECHYSCLTCDGPLQHNCLSCSIDEHRIYMEENKLCICETGYFNVEINEKCQTLNDLFHYVEMQEIIKYDFDCDYGYFRIYSNNDQFDCIQCPKQENGDLICLDCYLQYTTWYLYPMCTKDYLKIEQSSNNDYYYYERQQIEYSIYQIDFQLNLIYLQQFNYLCKTEDILQGIKECNKINIKPLNEFYAICQESYYYFNSNCHKCDSNVQNKNCLNFDNSELSNMISNIKCQVGQQLIQGQCQKCGQNCQYCIEDYNQITKNYYLRCIQCSNKNEYHLQIMDSQCIQNTITNCEYEYEQVIIDDIIYTTLDYTFQLQNQINQQNRCAKCKDYYAVNEDGNCIPISEISLKFDCLFAIYNNNSYQCIKGKYSNIIPLCNKQINCQQCIQLVSINKFYCILCKEGYYVDILTGQCISCLKQYNCEKCNQQIKSIQNDQIFDIMNYYEIIINKNGDHSFLEYGLSQNIKDYEVKCESCPENCLLCDTIDNQNVCKKCDYDNQGRQYSLINYYCKSCPNNCELCLPRTNNQQSQINQFFSDQTFQTYSLQCVQSTNQIAKFNTETGLFISCINEEQKLCEKSYLISMKLYCDYDEYLMAAEININNKYFHQKHIFIDDFLKTNFQIYYDELFYYIGNEVQVSTITFQLISDQTQTCQISKNFTIQSEIQNHIFTIRNQNLEIISSNLLIFEISGDLTIKNFQNIRFENIQFTFKASQFFNEHKILFQSQLLQTIQIINTIITTQNKQLRSRIYFYNFNQINLTNFQIIDFIQDSNSNHILNFIQDQSEGNIDIINLQIIQSILLDSSILNFETFSGIIIVLEDIFIQDSSFNNQNQLLFCNTESCGFLKIKSFTVLDSLIQNSIFLKANQFKNLEIENIRIRKIIFQNSIFLLFSTQIQLNSCAIQENYIQKSTFLVNIIKQSQENSFFQIEDLKFEQNSYDKYSKISYIQKFNYILSNIIVKDISIIDNIITESIDSNQYCQNNFSLFYFELHQLTLSNLFIQQGNGLNIFSLINFTEINIYNGNISLNQQGLNYIQNKLNFKLNFGMVFNFFSSERLQVQNLIIDSLIILNTPFISYKSQYPLLQIQDEFIMFSNIIITSNLLIQNDQNRELNFISIISEQNVVIIFNNIQFISNILLTQLTQNKFNLVSLLNIDCLLCKVQFQQSSFINNNVLNSSLTINYIISNELIFNETNFINNGVKEFQFPPLFSLLEIILQSDTIYQKSGIGYFSVKIFKMLNSNIISTQGSLAGGFIFAPTSQGLLLIENSNFQNISNYFYQITEKSGIIYIQNSIENLNIKIANSNFSDIYSFYGGILLIENSHNNLSIILQNLSFTSINSIQGSLLKVIFSQFEIKSSQIKIINVNITNSKDSNQFLKNKYKNFDAVQQQILKQQMLYHCFILTKFGKIIIQGVNILESYEDILLYDDSYIEFIGSDISIKNSLYSQKGLIYLIPYNLAKTIVRLNKIFISNSSIITDIDSSIGIINFQQVNENTTIKFSGLQISDNNFSKCENGIINIIGQSMSENSIMFLNIELQKNLCGLSSCINIKDPQIRLLQNQTFAGRILSSLKQYQIVIKSYNCAHNKANYGVCITLVNFNAIIQQSKFSNNSALLYGGAFAYFGRQKLITFEECVITENTAKIGGGAYFQSSFLQNFTQLQTYFIKNQALSFGSEFKEIPSQLKLQIYKDSLITNNFKTSVNNKVIDYSQYPDSNQLYISQTIIQNLTFNYFRLPSGQQIYQYQYFNWQFNKYDSLNLILKLTAYDLYEEQIKNLGGSKCIIQGRVFNFLDFEESEKNLFTQNFTNLNEVYYNTKNEDYDLNDLIIYFDPDLPDNLVLQLQFQCDSIKIPIYQNQEIIDQSDEYYLRVNIKTFPCQLGELKLETDKSCHPCDYTQDLYSVVLNATKCKIRDNQIMEQVKSAQIKLRTGYWRPYINTDDIENCYNQQSNCQGGWDIGDKSCAIGHIGALCEQCDIHNIKGEGSYSISKKYSCGSCDDTKSNTLIIIGISLWTLISILISVKSTVEIVKQLARATKLKSIGISIVVNKNNAVNLIKILTNYLQIIASVTTFQLSLPKNMDYFINSLGNPIETMAYSLDCFLKDMFQNIEIQYSRTIWQLIMPILYVLVFFQLYGLGITLKLVDFSFSAIPTSLIYMFIYFQPNIVAGQIGLLSYRTISDYKWILGNVAYRYDNQVHTTWILSYSLPIILVIGLIIPLFFNNRLHNIKTALNNIKNRLIWGYLYNEYKQQAYFWEIVKIIEKELIIIALTFYSDSIIVKAALVYAVIFIYNYFTILINPYQSIKLNILDHLSTKICGFSIVFGIGIYGALNNNIIEVQIPFYIILALVNFLFLTKLIFEIIKAYFQKFEVLLDKVRDAVKKMFPDLLNHPYFNSLLKNQAETRQRALQRFKKIKAALILISKKQIQKQYQYQNSIKQKQTIVIQESIMLQTVDQNLAQHQIVNEQENQKLIGN